jgi:hypothetical protein
MIHQSLLKYYQIVQLNEGIMKKFGFYLTKKWFRYFSGVTVGDHIIYIGPQNIQNIGSFNEMIDLINRNFKNNGQITLTTLTRPAYQVLKQRGGYLEDTTFDYQSLNINEMKPRLCKLTLYNHEPNFGFRFKYGNRIYVRDVEVGSAADAYEIKKDDRILELNGHDTTHLSHKEINEIIKKSEEDRKLDILVIDKHGDEFSMRHAIPLNSFLPFVQSPEERGKFRLRVIENSHRKFIVICF